MLEIFSLQTRFFTDMVILHSHHVHPSALLLELAHGNLASGLSTHCRSHAI